MMASSRKAIMYLGRSTSPSQGAHSARGIAHAIARGIARGIHS